MKLLILGANGQVGHELRAHLAPLGHVFAASRSGSLADHARGVAIDVGNSAALACALDELQPDVIVNAAAYTGVDRAEDEEVLATAINGDVPAQLAAWAANRGALVVHYSTDYVFDGEGKIPYTEDAATAPLGAYGRSKRAGEVALENSGAAWMNFRTAWVYGARGKNFLLTMLRLGAERDELSVVADQIGAPTTAVLLARATAAAIAHWHAAKPADRRGLVGTYHLVASGQTSWHGFAETIFAGATLRGLITRSPRVAAIGTAQFPTPARRPAYSVLDNQRFAQTFHFNLPPWQEGLDETLDAVAHSNFNRIA